MPAPPLKVVVREVSMQRLCAELGYLKYTEFLSADKIFTLTYRDRALRELGRR